MPVARRRGPPSDTGPTTRVKIDMRKTLVAVALLCSTAAFAQSEGPAPNAGDKPRAVAKPQAMVTTPGSIAEKLLACLEIEDNTQNRLDCYDAAIKPMPKPNPPPAKGVRDCKFLEEPTERMACYNGFAATIPHFR
jgi:hypothetical protein